MSRASGIRVDDFLSIDGSGLCAGTSDQRGHLHVRSDQILTERGTGQKARLDVSPVNVSVVWAGSMRAPGALNHIAAGPFELEKEQPS